MKNQYQLVLFDVDSTLIEQEVIDLLANRTPHGAQVADITRRAMSGEIDFDGAFAKESHFFEDFQNLSYQRYGTKLLSRLELES